MPVRWLFYVFTIAACTAFWSCEDCGPSDEPILTLQLSAQTAFQIDTLYGIGATGKPVQPFSSKASGPYVIFQLPINLNADSTRYAFVIDKHLETITVYYKRNFYYKNGTCGYVFDLYPSATDPLRNVQLTRGKVDNIYYTQNSFNGGFLRPATSETGIQLSISL
ncbi:hypothetical protein [Spirosoma gilvum]